MKNKLKGQDKLMHSKVGNVIYIFTFTFLLPFVSIQTSLIISFFTLLILALSKELYDKYYKRTFIDWWDIVAAFIPYPIVKIINNIK
jgi:hypothetical protein|nr:MAG TPA: putative periplasmic lipoprotein [Caudoviricetes sp.]